MEEEETVKFLARTRAEQGAYLGEGTGLHPSPSSRSEREREAGAPTVS